MCNIVDNFKKRRVKVNSDSFVPIKTVREVAASITIILEENNNVVISKKNKIRVRSIINEMYGRKNRQMGFFSYLRKTFKYEE